MKFNRRVKKTYLKLITSFHREDCDCDKCIKKSLIGRCGMGKRMSKKYSKVTYLKNRFLLFLIYDLWVWIGESKWMEKSNVWYNAFKWWGDRKWFGLTFVERYKHSQKVKKVLNDSLLKVQKKYPNFELK